MIYLDNGATSLHKPPQVARRMAWATQHCANPGRGGYPSSMLAAKTVYQCRETASALFDCQPEQVVFTANCTHGLNLAIHSLVKPGDRVAVTGFEHNAVVRPLYARKAEMIIAGQKLFDWADTLERFEKTLKSGVSAAVFTHCSNVFGYILPVDEMAVLCKQYQVPFIIDAAQSAGVLPVRLEKTGAAFIAMPGHKGLLGPQGTGILLCNYTPKALLQGGTGTDSINRLMPTQTPEALEAGTVNVPGIAGLCAGLQWVKTVGTENIYCRERQAAERCARGLESLGYTVFYGDHQGGTVSFLGHEDPEEIAMQLGQKGIAVRAGLHCAPLAHESAGTLQTGTVRVSFGHDATCRQADRFLECMSAQRS